MKQSQNTSFNSDDIIDVKNISISLDLLENLYITTLQQIALLKS